MKLVERLTKNSHAVTLDKLEDVAKAVGLQAWQLLLPDVDPENPPTASLTTEDKALLDRLRRALNE